MGQADQGLLSLRLILDSLLIAATNNPTWSRRIRAADSPATLWFRR